jgi:sugar lactone lactonase YvrE
MTGGPEVVHAARAEVGEGPCWDVARGVLLWVDIYRGLVHLLNPASGLDTTLDAGQPVGAVVPAAGGDLVAAVRDGFVRIDPATARIEVVAPVEEDLADHLMNDGKCDPCGAFVAGTLHRDELAGAGTLYRLNPDRSVDRLVSGVTLSNGLAWSPSGDRMYYVDSATQAVDVFEYDASGRVGDRRRFVEITPDDGMPDGLAVDAEGGVWVALWGGSEVRRYTTAGALDDVVELPVSQVTSCAFGGDDWGDLYITSASWELDEARVQEDSLAGAVFVARPGVAGVPTSRFAGSA